MSHIFPTVNQYVCHIVSFYGFVIQSNKEIKGLKYLNTNNKRIYLRRKFGFFASNEKCFSVYVVD